MFSCEFCKVFNSSYSIEHLDTAAFECMAPKVLKKPIRAFASGINSRAVDFDTTVFLRALHNLSEKSIVLNVAAYSIMQ